MWKSIYSWKSTYSLLLSLVLMSGSLVACVQTGPETKSSPSTTSIPLPDQGNLDQENLKNSFDDVQKTNNEFQTLLDDFIKDIAAVREGSKNRESVNSSKVNEKLIQLEEKVNTYKNQISQTRNQENLEQNFNGINQNISNIKEITEKLKGGLGKDKIGEVQLSLQIITNPEVSYFGRLGPDTESKINESLTENSKQLKAKIIDLGQVTGLPSSVTPDKDDDKELARKIADLEARNNELAAIAKKNEEEIKNLNSEKQEFYNQLNQFKNRRRLEIFIVIIVLAIAVLLSGLCVYIWQEERRKKWLLERYIKAYGNTQKQNNAVNQTGDLDTQTLVYKELFHEVHEKVEYVEKMYKLWVNEAKKIQGQIYYLQQNQQVKTPGNNVDNKKFIVKVVDDRIGDIYRRLQQEIEQRWDIESRKLQNQINQLQQNQQLRTSDNVAGVYREPQITTNHVTSQVTPVPQINPQIPTHQYSGSSDLQLISMYQHDARSLLKNATQVSETEQSIDQRRLGGAQGAILRKDRKGNYWVLQEGGVDYMVPKNNIKINEYSLNTVANLFECQGYRSGYSGFQLIKPARVSAISRGEAWQVVERGVLQFY
ncbi:MAG: hypothetical protein MGG37_10640 [Trichodesmium sp. MAG_R01]|nr:hypothetical protein [Trichodesmium sp. MAG_R01]